MPAEGCVIARVLDVVVEAKTYKTTTLDIGQPAPITVVTSASNIGERTVGKLVCCATVGTEIGDEKVTRRSVGGTMSEGMLMDSPLLGWAGGASGVAVLIPESGFAPGDKPPMSRPRQGDSGAATPPVAPVIETMFERKQTKEERKAAAKAAREAKKAAKGAKKSSSTAAAEVVEPAKDQAAPPQLPGTTANSTTAPFEQSTADVPPSSPSPASAAVAAEPTPPQPPASPAEASAPSEAVAPVTGIEATREGEPRPATTTPDTPGTEIASVFSKKKKPKKKTSVDTLK